MASIEGDTAAKSAADAIGLASGIAAGVITARWLGPEGKGIFSSLTLIAGLAIQAASLGLGDALVVLTNRGQGRIHEAIPSTLVAAALTSVVAAGAVFGVSAWQFPTTWSAERLAIGAISMTVPVTVLGQVGHHALIAQGKLIRSSVAVASASLGTTLAIGVYVILLDLGLPGAILGSLTGTVVGGGVAWVALRGTSPRSRWVLSTDYVRDALRFGVVVQVAYLTMAAAGRVDLLLVLNLGGEAAAGQYSVALTVGGLAITLPAALAYAVYPRMAATSEAEVSDFMGLSLRAAVAAAILSAVGLALAAPYMIPVLFGGSFEEAVLPTWLLLPGAPLWAAQWVLSRMAAARGRPRVMVVSFAVNVLLMVGLDVLLVPILGLAGASVSAVSGSAAGLVVAYSLYRRYVDDGVQARHLLPELADFRRVAGVPVALLRRMSRAYRPTDESGER